MHREWYAPCRPYTPARVRNATRATEQETWNIFQSCHELRNLMEHDMTLPQWCNMLTSVGQLHINTYFVHEYVYVIQRHTEYVQQTIAANWIGIIAYWEGFIEPKSNNIKRELDCL